MKKNIFKLLTVLIALMCMGLTSCFEEDDELAAELNGTWHGVLGTYYYSHIYGSSYQEWETEFHFDVSSGNATSGTGMQIDYDPDEWSAYKYYSFTWRVIDGSIALYFSTGDQWVLREFALTDNTLGGTLESVSGDKIGEISLTRTSYWPWSSSSAKATRAVEDKCLGVKRELKE
jgi:hypothetical protein